MNFATLLLVVSLASAPWSDQQSGTPNETNKAAEGLPAMCEAAASKLKESGTDQVVLAMTINGQGHVLSFKTEAPKGLRLEKVKKAAAEIKAIRFGPARKDGNPVAVMIRAAFQCP